MNLSEFLLARIAEDEEAASDAASRPGAAEWPDLRVYDDGSRDPAVVASPARVLAECEAKRRIVEGFRMSEEAGIEMPTWVLGHLALPYADHPDYDETWRP